MHAGREADDQQPRLPVAKRFDRSGMVTGVFVANAGEEAG
jgi:hypothetical protein